MNVLVNASLTLVGVSAMFIAAPLRASAQEMSYPEKCKSEGMDMSSGGNMKMSSDKMPMGNMTDYQKASMGGMKEMHANMIQGMMKKDADVAFVCGMIAHHMGAISMSEAELKHGDNKWAKQTVQKIIDAQRKEIEEMTQWLGKEAK